MWKLLLNFFILISLLYNLKKISNVCQLQCHCIIIFFFKLLIKKKNFSFQILPVVTKIRERELNYRQQLEYYGLNNKEKLPLPGSGKRKKGQKFSEDEDDYECENCRATLFVSLVNNSQDDSVYCLPHGLQLIGRKKQVLKHCTLKYTYSEVS